MPVALLVPGIVGLWGGTRLAMTGIIEVAAALSTQATLERRASMSGGNPVVLVRRRGLQRHEAIVLIALNAVYCGVRTAVRLSG